MFRILWSLPRPRCSAVQGRWRSRARDSCKCLSGSHSASSVGRSSECHPLAGTEVCEILRPKQGKREQVPSGAAVGSNDAWDLQDRAKRVAIKGGVGAEGKVRGLRKRPREYDGAMPGHREGLLDFERDARRRNPLLVGPLAVAA